MVLTVIKYTMETFNYTIEEVTAILRPHSNSAFIIRLLNKYNTLREFLEQEYRYNVSQFAYWWAKHIGHQNFMIKYVTHDDWIYKWGCEIEYKDGLASRIRSSYFALNWAIDIGDRDLMKPKVKNGLDIEVWNRFFPEDRIVIDGTTLTTLGISLREMTKIARKKHGCKPEIRKALSYGSLGQLLKKAPLEQISYWAWWWATTIGNQDIMRQYVLTSFYIHQWNKTFPHDRIEYSLLRQIRFLVKRYNPFLKTF